MHPPATAAPPRAPATENGSGAPPRRPAVAPRRRNRLLDRWVSPIALLVGWQLGASLGILPERLLPAPSTVAATALGLLQDGSLVDAVGVSLQRVLTGFAIGATAGIALAVVVGLSRWGDNLVDPPLQMLRTVPIFGLIPLFILWFGIGETPKVALVALAVTIPLYVNTAAGIRGVDPKFRDVAHVLRLSRLGVIRHVVLPGSLPGLLVGLRLSLGSAWLALIVAEQINADAGLGFMINSAREFLRTDIVVLGLIVYSLLGLITDAFVRLLERRALVWRRAFGTR
ncbi:sulfonate transport system permease protein [Murinocardiopsis flavida]|uniref:Sulfonate transport system permease protein n=1 Tax=Murinocardiopsis flavida TaxID=645275 RepID=A0A2P8CXJ7_9ACTN|nr:ABC transporter permease [Murinocardiopsis flavida]PSK89647.1 sulfonate transport system permease protein [Murinocardiopsis flavida]